MMVDKDKKMKGIVLLVVGIIFLLSLVVCIYITYSEKDLKETTAEVTNFNVALSGSKKNVTIIYTVDGMSYSSSFYTEDSLTIGDTIKIYYHEKDATVAKLYKTSLIIFICPIIGLFLCIIGLIKVLKKRKDKDEIIIEDELKEEIIPEPNKIVSLEEPDFDNEMDNVGNDDLDENEEPDFDSIANLPKEDDIVLPLDNPSTELANIAEDEMPVTKEEEVIEEENLLEEKNDIKEDKMINLVNVLPNNYYISGETLIYEEFSNHKEEIELRDIDKLVITINSENKVVKLVVYTEKIKCILTKMKNIDLDKMVNSLKNKMNVIQKEFEETIEYKEY